MRVGNVYTVLPTLVIGFLLVYSVPLEAKEAWVKFYKDNTSVYYYDANSVKRPMTIGYRVNVKVVLNKKSAKELGVDYIKNFVSVNIVGRDVYIGKSEAYNKKTKTLEEIPFTTDQRYSKWEKVDWAKALGTLLLDKYGNIPSDEAQDIREKYEDSLSSEELNPSATAIPKQ